MTGLLRCAVAETALRRRLRYLEGGGDPLPRELEVLAILARRAGVAPSMVLIGGDDG